MMGISPTTKVKKDDSVIQTVKGLRVRFDGNAGENADIVFNTKPFVACSNKICIPRQKLWKEGTHAVYITEKNIKIKTAAEQMKNRPWSQGLFIRTK